MLIHPAALLLAAVPAPGPVESPRIEPTVALDSTISFRSFALDSGGSVQREYHPLYKPIGVWLGLQAYYRDAGGFATGGWRGTFELGLQTSTPTSGFPVGFAHTSVREWKVRRRASLYAGVRLAFFLDAPTLRYNHAEVGAALGLSTRRVDVAWTPGVSVPLSVDRRDVYGGELRRSVALMVIPFHLTLRFKLGPRRRAPDPSRARPGPAAKTTGPRH